MHLSCSNKQYMRALKRYEDENMKDATCPSCGTQQVICLGGGIYLRLSEQKPMYCLTCKTTFKTNDNRKQNSQASNHIVRRILKH